MPLLTFDVIEGRSEDEIKTLLDAAHRAGHDRHLLVELAGHGFTFNMILPMCLLLPISACA